MRQHPTQTEMAYDIPRSGRVGLPMLDSSDYHSILG